VNGTLVDAHFQDPWEIAGDGANHLYVADQNVIRAIDQAAGVVTTLAGTAGPPGTADGVGPAASFNLPSGLAYGGGQLYLSDTENHTIRKIDVASAQSTTLAGAAGQRGSADGAAADARFGEPEGIALDGDNLYISDTDNNTIRVLALSTGMVSTLAGQVGVAGLADGAGVAALLDKPKAMRVDAAGSLYVADAFNNAVRKVVPTTASVTTLATFASVPQGLAIDGDDLLVTLEGPTDSRIVRIAGAVSPGCTACAVSDVAGSATQQGFVDGVGTAARLDSPGGLWNDGAGHLLVADSENYALRSMALSTTAVTTYAGALSVGSADGTGSRARFSAPQGIVADGTTVYVADTGNHTIRAVDLATGSVTTLAGTAGQSGHADGSGTSAQFHGPEGLALDGATQTLYVADTLNRAIRQIDLATGLVSTPPFALAPTFQGLDAPSGVVVYQDQLFVTDYQDDDVVMIDLGTAAMSTLAGTWGTPGTADGVGQAAGFYGPQGIAADGLGNLYVADSQGCTVRKIEIATSTVTTIAGQPAQSGSVDGPGAQASFDQPFGIAADTYGDLYVADTLNNLVRHVDLSTGAVTTVIGTRAADGVLLGPLPGQLTQPGALALTPSNGLLLVSESSLLLAH
jgi:sugar lactone lactonase YvrE